MPPTPNRGTQGEPRRAARRDSSATSAALRALLDPVAAAAGLEIEAITITAAGRRSVVRIVVDADHDVDLESIADVSRAIAAALDAEEASALIDGAYQLEVSSPGVDRPLTEPRHWRRAVGRLVAVDVGGERVTGRVLSADTTGVVLSITGISRTVDWTELGAGRVQVEFNRDNESDQHHDGKAAARTGEG